MLIVTTRSKALHKWSRLMFWAFPFAALALQALTNRSATLSLALFFGGPLTMHYRPAPKEKKRP